MFEMIFARSGCKKDQAWSRFIFQWLTISLILHIIAAVRSSGFYHADEHFQIAEFINFKMGRSAATDLPLEFNHLLRPWLLPAILTGLTWFLDVIGISNPFDWATSYRLIGALLGWISLVGLSLCCYVWFPQKKWRNWAVIFLNFIWFIPSLHARHSSENFGGSLFFIGLSLLILASPQRTKHHEHPGAIPLSVSIGVGILFGFAFEFRYQVGAMIAGTVLWLLLVARAPLKQILALCLAALIPIGLGTWADRWGYGQWTFAPWNYLHYNIIQNHVSDSEISPWWDFFRRSITESWPILGLIALVSLPIAWLRKPLHILTWSMLPFFLTHVLIAHKELRFLFPLAHAAGILIIFAALPPQWLDRLKISTALKIKSWIQWPLRLLFVWNGIALVIITLLPAWTPIHFYKQLYQFKPYHFEVYYKDDSLFNFGGATMNFYRPLDTPFHKVESYQEVVASLQNREYPLWLFSPKLTIPEEASELKDRCKAEFSTLPQWIGQKLNDSLFASRFPRVTNWTLFKCQNPNGLKLDL
jgi:phosphatidylinositol glycan class B